MTAPSYTTNLGDVSLCDALGTWVEMSTRKSGGSAILEDRAYIEGNYSISQSTGAATGRTAGMEFDYGSNISWTAGWVFLVWQYWQAPKAIGTWADGGMRFGVGDSAGNYNLWNTQGNDYGLNPYGGWANVAIDPTYTADETEGSPTAGNYRWVCSAPYILSAVSKGNPHCVDAIRYGRADLVVQYGALADGYATFAGMGTTNDASRWGLFQATLGGYMWKGLMSLGTASVATEFVDANRVITVDQVPRTYAAFNRIEIRNASSVVTWTNISFNSLSTLSPGQLEVIDNADVNINGCSFQNMDTFIFLSNSSVTDSTFKNCKEINSGGGVFTGTKVLTPSVTADSYGIYWNSATNPDGYLDNMSFTKGTNDHHAIEFGTSSSTTITLRGISFTDFSASNSQNHSVLNFLESSGGVTYTVQCIGCTGTVSYKSAGAVVNVTQGVLTQITVRDVDTKAVISGARVLVASADGTNFPYNASVTITGSGTTATVTHTAHGLSTGDKVLIAGANEDEYNGAFSITYISSSSYSYTTTSTVSSSPATGTITSTFVFISGTTDGSGVISDQRVLPSGDQPITGWARKSTSSPYYKESPISSTVSEVSGVAITALMVRDDA